MSNNDCCPNVVSIPTLPDRPQCVTVCSTSLSLSMRKRNTVAWIMIVGPWVLLVVVLAVFAITGFIVSKSMPSVVGEALTAAPSMRDTIGRVINVILGFLGVVAVLGIPVGTAVGVYLLSTKRDQIPPSPQA